MGTFGYLVATALAVAATVLKLKEIVLFVRVNALGSGLAPLLARFNRLGLLSSMLYTLKDAASRDRLSGSTFIQLNFLCAIGLLVNGLFISGGLKSTLGAANAIFAVFCAFHGVTSYIRNRYL